MEERLRKLKSAMNKTVFKDVAFSEKQRSAILENIASKKDPEIDILQILRTRKTGFELSRALIGRGVKNFSHNEGMLYVLLHKLESSGFVTSEWDEKQKYYLISNKGMKALKKQEEERGTSSLLKEITEGGV